MHKYIDINILRDFSKPMDIDDIIDVLYDVYDIQNVEDEFCMGVLAEALYDDLFKERANYKAYIEKGMNARMLMELRKSAIMPMGEELFSFYTDHSTCETVEDVKAFRIERLQFMCVDYMDLEWQYYYATRHFLGQKGKDLIINFESCYQDCDMSKASNIDTYKREFVINNTPPEWLERERRLAKVCSNREFYT